MAGGGFELSVEIGGKRFEKAQQGLNHLADRFGKQFGELTPIARRELKNILDTVIKAMRERHSASWSPGRVGPTGDARGKLAKRSGRGLNSLKATTTTKTDEIIGKIDVGFPFAVHEKGAVVKAKSGKYLAIPLPAALDSRGIPLKRRTRDWRNTFVGTSKKGNLLIFQRNGPNLIPLYILKKQTRIPRRLGMRVTMEKAAPLFVDRLFAAAVKELSKI